MSSGRMSLTRMGWVGIALCVAAVAGAEESIIRADIWEYPILLSAGKMRTWQIEGKPRGFLAEEGFRWQQGPLQLDADGAAVWFDEKLAKETGEVALDVYAEGRITIMQEGRVDRYEQVLVRTSSSGAGAGLAIREVFAHLDAPAKSPLLLRGEGLRKRVFTDFASTKPVVQPTKETVAELEAVGATADKAFGGWEEEGKMAMVLDGNVVFRRRDMTLTADSAVLWVRKGGKSDKAKGDSMGALEEFYAKGHVTLHRDEDIITASEVYENVVEDRGVYYDARIALRSAKPGIFFQADEVVHAGKGQYEAVDGSFSTSEFAKPEYDILAKRVRLVRSARTSVLSAAHNFFRIGRTPLFYWPYGSHDVRDRQFVIRSLRVGRSSDMGTFAETRWSAYEMFGVRSESTQLELLVDQYSKRGTGVGADFGYGWEGSFGSALGYYINDRAKIDRPGQPVPSKNRGRFLWRHRTDFPRGWRVEAEVAYLSDRNFLREFFEDEFQEGKEQETVFYLRRLKDNRGFTYLQKHRINSFDTTVEQLPALEYNVIGEPALSDIVVYTSKTQLAHLGRKVDTHLRVRDPERTVRLHTQHEFAIPMKLWMVRLAPFYRFQFTAADEGRSGALAPRIKRHRARRRVTRSRAQQSADEATLIGQRDSGGVYRAANTFGFNASSDLWRIYNAHSELLDVNRIRHIMTPELQYEFTPSVSNEPMEFNQFDETDRTDEFHRIMFGFRNRFQTKRGDPGHERTVDFLVCDLEYSVYPGSSGRNEEFDDLVELDVIYRVRDWLSYVSEGNEFNFGTGNWEVISNGVKLEPSERWSVYLGHRRIHRTSSTVTFDLEHEINERWTVRLFEQYDFAHQVDAGRDRGGQNLESVFVLRRRLHKWVLDISLERDEGEEDNRVSLALAHVGSERRLRRY